MRLCSAFAWPVGLLVALGMTAPAAAQSPSSKGEKKEETAPKSEKKAGEPRRDPEGRTGISPYMEAIAKGEKAFVARDLVGAVEAFQEAIKLDGQRLLGFYRLGEAQLERGNVNEAEAAWQTAQARRGPPDLQAKVLFCLADLRERQGKWQDAKDAWIKYASFAQNEPKANAYPATAAERLKQIDRRVKDEKDYGAVKERIAARQAEREREALENAKKDKLNR